METAKFIDVAQQKQGSQIMKTLLLGPNFHKSGEVGGIVVSFDLMVDEFRQANIPIEIIDLNKSNYLHKLIAPLSILIQALYWIPQSNAVILNGTAKDFKYIAPVIVFLSKLFNKPVLLRKFAGSFIEEYEKSSTMIKKLVDYALKHATANFFQTRYLVNYFKKWNTHTYWLPTSRKKSAVIRDQEMPYAKRLIYLGHIRKEKGILDLVALANHLDESYTIDLYGAMIETELEPLITDAKLHYCGELQPQEVIPTLTQYDLLILPSYREGYPGVIIEALSVGLPVIATNLESIAEIIDASCGILVEPGDITALQQAVSSFDSDNYAKFSAHALDRFNCFESRQVTEKVIAFIPQGS